jgi:hypothetical protein
MFNRLNLVSKALPNHVSIDLGHFDCAGGPPPLFQNGFSSGQAVMKIDLPPQFDAVFRFATICASFVLIYGTINFALFARGFCTHAYNCPCR